MSYKVIKTESIVFLIDPSQAISRTVPFSTSGAVLTNQQAFGGPYLLVHPGHPDPPTGILQGIPFSASGYTEIAEVKLQVSQPVKINLSYPAESLNHPDKINLSYPAGSLNHPYSKDHPGSSCPFPSVLFGSLPQL